MKLNELKAIAEYLKRFKYIKRARRVRDNIIELTFNGDISLLFNMKRGCSANI